MKLASIRSIIVAAFATALAASGCAYGPLDGDRVSAGDKVDWKGFATAANTVVELQAQQPWDGAWVTFDTATSESNDWNSENGRSTFDRQLYQWYKDGVTIPAWAFNGSGHAAVRAVQGSAQYPMWMFDTPGFQCLSQKFFAAYNSNTTMNTEDADQTCSRATNGGKDRNYVTVHR
jgi:hypothetical protein